MTPGLSFYLAGLFLAASAPVILVAVLACVFIPSAIWVARPVALGGLLGAALGGLWWLLANVYDVPPGYFSWPEGTAVCAAGFSFGGLASLVISAASRGALRKVAPALAAVMLGNALALLSVSIERKGPELMSYGNMCGPNFSGECSEPALKGGFPLTYLTDMPGVSVEHQLSFGEDLLHPVALILDIAFFIAVVVLVGRLTSRGLRLTEVA